LLHTVPSSYVNLPRKKSPVSARLPLAGRCAHAPTPAALRHVTYLMWSMASPLLMSILCRRYVGWGSRTSSSCSPRRAASADCAALASRLHAASDAPLGVPPRAPVWSARFPGEMHILQDALRRGPFAYITQTDAAQTPAQRREAFVVATPPERPFFFPCSRFSRTGFRIVRDVVRFRGRLPVRAPSPRAGRRGRCGHGLRAERPGRAQARPARDKVGAGAARLSARYVAVRASACAW